MGAGTIGLVTEDGGTGTEGGTECVFFSVLVGVRIRPLGHMGAVCVRWEQAYCSFRAKMMSVLKVVNRECDSEVWKILFFLGWS